MIESHRIKPHLEAVESDRSTLPSILVAGFCGALGAGLAHVIGADPHLRVLQAGADADLAAAIAEHEPDVALVELEALGGAIELRRLVLAYPETGIVVGVGRLSRQRDETLLSAGARVVVPITVDATELRGVLRLVACRLIGPPLPQRSTAAAGLGVLTARETEVVQLLLNRRSAREIGRALHVTVATVNTHCRHIYEKLGIHGRRELEQRAGELLGIAAPAGDVGSGGDGGRMPFRRRFLGMADSGRPTMADMCVALGWNGTRRLRV